MLRIYSIANNLLGSAVASTTEDRDVMVTCLQLGAADYMMKPLRLPELRNLWARVYWWRRVSGPSLVTLIRNDLADFLLVLSSLPALFHKKQELLLVQASYLQQQSSGSDTPAAKPFAQLSGSSLDTIW